MEFVVIALTPYPVRAEPVEAWACALIRPHACAQGGCRDVRPAAHLLFLRRQEKKAKEGDPTVCVPALRSGQPAVLASSGVSLKLASFHCAQTVAIPDPLTAALLGAYRGDGTAEQPNIHSGHRVARPRLEGATDPTQVCPFAKRRGRRLGIAFLLGTFLWRSKEKYLACRGDNPAPALGTGMRPNQPTSPSFDRLNPNGLGNCMRELSIK
jgi:hypothetical protein